ncbi:DUF1028 domain-containing protein [Halocalculus aciditolerans]|uniref:DUF1028 domain-containing protein n=1 Tax=Halocalculus aciditolerans TaxID=1383812 RepID=A0A830FFM3_9EURY|nr:DUF1028 domain-containing protein [Halocalculus aciditolerans]GGL69852.1 hypothetical protein GCM10009039_29840 [Halocalculus aciditolerans]
MTFSICVHETYEGDDGEEHDRFGVAVTTRLPAVGTLCPFVSENAAVATQSLVNVDLGERGVEYIDDGLAVEDALQSLLNADDGQSDRQLHGVDADGSFAFSGDDCRGWYGHTSGDGYTVAGNLLTGESVVTETAAAYEAGRETDAPLIERLIDALGAGQGEGGDKREDLPVQSAAVCVATTEDTDSYYDDLRVDASESPISDLRETYRLAKQGERDALAKYADETGDGEVEHGNETEDGNETNADENAAGAGDGGTDAGGNGE